MKPCASANGAEHMIATSATAALRLKNSMTFRILILARFARCVVRSTACLPDAGIIEPLVIDARNVDGGEAGCAPLQVIQRAGCRQLADEQASRPRCERRAELKDAR